MNIKSYLLYLVFSCLFISSSVFANPNLSYLTPFLPSDQVENYKDKSSHFVINELGAIWKKLNSIPQNKSAVFFESLFSSFEQKGYQVAIELISYNHIATNWNDEMQYIQPSALPRRIVRRLISKVDNQSQINSHKNPLKFLTNQIENVLAHGIKNKSHLAISFVLRGKNDVFAGVMDTGVGMDLNNFLSKPKDQNFQKGNLYNALIPSRLHGNTWLFSKGKMAFMNLKMNRPSLAVTKDKMPQGTFWLTHMPIKEFFSGWSVRSKPNSDSFYSNLKYEPITNIDRQHMEVLKQIGTSWPQGKMFYKDQELQYLSGGWNHEVFIYNNESVIRVEHPNAPLSTQHHPKVIQDIRHLGHIGQVAPLRSHGYIQSTNNQKLKATELTLIQGDRLDEIAKDNQGILPDYILSKIINNLEILINEGIFTELLYHDRNSIHGYLSDENPNIQKLYLADLDLDTVRYMESAVLAQKYLDEYHKEFKDLDPNRIIEKFLRQYLTGKYKDISDVTLLAA